jgi:hypothetical protein
MMVHAKWSALRQSRWYEYLLRFALGGLTTVIAGVIADRWGPQAGGLFLAFPAIFCASATLIEKHERERKQQHGLQGHRRGTDACALDAAGAAIGSGGLAAFAIAVWLLAGSYGFLSLVFASLAWLAVAIAGWRLRRDVCRLS